MRQYYKLTCKETNEQVILETMEECCTWIRENNKAFAVWGSDTLTYELIEVTENQIDVI
jgi:hypothetical protein